MSMFKAWSLLAALCLTPCFALAAPTNEPAANQAEPAVKAAVGGSSLVSHLDRYVKADGTGYYALSLAPAAATPPAAGHDIALLFDTSASQAGPFRAKGLETLEALIKQLPATDRVQLFAVDLSAVPLTTGACSPQGEGIQQAISKLKNRAPLGATDLPLALETARAALADGPAAGSADGAARTRSIVYIGDGRSVAGFVDLDAFRTTVAKLASSRVSLSCLAIGPSLDTSLLAGLANQTGGMMAVDGDNFSSRQFAQYLSIAVHGAVLWPGEVKWPAELGEVYPRQLPPLRADRETVVVGQGKPAGLIALSAVAECLGAKVPLSWSVETGGLNEDLSFLPQLIDVARQDGGVTLPTVGDSGLRETGRLLAANTEKLAALGNQALASGAYEDAAKLADEALRRDPRDPMALAVKRKLSEVGAGGGAKPAPEKAERRGLKLGKPDDKHTAIDPRESTGAAPGDRVASAPPDFAAAAGFVAPLGLGLFAVPDELPADAPTEPGMLNQVLRDTGVARDFLRFTVTNAIKSARNHMGDDPAGGKQNLKLLLDQVRRAPELNSEDRYKLETDIVTVLHEIDRRLVEKEANDLAAYNKLAAARERERLVQVLESQQEKEKQLMDRFNSLMAEGRYLEAEEGPAAEIATIDPHSPVAVAATLDSRMTMYVQRNTNLRIRDQKGFIDTLAQAEISGVPFPDDQPIVYPDAQFWQELTLRRKQYASVDLKQSSPAEKKIRKALDDPTVLEFVETPLSDVIQYLKELHQIEIQVDTKKLEEANVSLDTPITKTLRGISLKSALRLMLAPLELSYVIKDEVLLITTKEDVDQTLVTKVYPVADLVLPIRSGAMGGGMGGGMGGMGGMGMGGGMGRGMGGFFAVADDAASPPPSPPKGLKLGGSSKGAMASPIPQAKPEKAKSDKAAPEKATSEKAAPEKAAPAQPAADGADPAVAAPLATGKRASSVAKPAKGDAAVKAAAIRLTIAADADPNVVWNDYFANHPEVTPAAVSATAVELMHARQFDHLVALIQSALRAGQPQPWMYEAMGLALQAGGRPQEEVERALMSGVDLSDSLDDLMYVAQYMARSGLEDRALKIFRQIGAAAPMQPEAFVYGLKLAQHLDRPQDVQWASLGILRQAWPADKHEVFQAGMRAATATVERLKAENRPDDAAAFQAQIDSALERDCVVKVTWTGDADVDMYVQEPSGAICSFRNPRTTGGGVMMGDSASRGAQATKDGYSESYVCPLAFSGPYRVQLRRVWGKITAGKVTVELYSHYGSKNMKHMSDQVKLGEEDAVVAFDLPDGRRKDPLDQQVVANAVAATVNVNQAILAQQLSSIANPGAAGGQALSRAALFGGFNSPFLRGAVGYMPVITTLPTGANMQATGVISADRRYVRITATPLFSQIGQVTTFNIASGRTGMSPSPGVGGGGVAAGGGIGGAGGNGGVGAAANR